MDLTATKTLTSVLDDRSWLASSHGTSSTRSRTLDGDSVRALFPAGGFLPSGVVLAGTDDFAPATLYAGTTNEVQTITIGGAGLTSFTLTLSGDTTDPIDASASAQDVEDALEAVAGAGTVFVEGNAGGPYRVTFVGGRADTDVAQMTATPTGGTGTVTVATATAGGAAGTDTAIGHLYSGQVVPEQGDLHVAILNHGEIHMALLPANHGLDAAARADLTHIRYL